MTSSLKAVNDRILVLLEQHSKDAEVTIGEIYIPEKNNETTLIGKVVSVGSGFYIGNSHHNFEVKIGDRVMFNKYSSTVLPIPYDEYASLKHDEILCVIKG